MTTYPADAFANLLSRLSGVRQRDDRAIAQCPAHEDRSPSLSVRRAEDRVLVHCFAGCSIDEITAALGITTASLFDGGGKRVDERQRRARVNLAKWRDRAMTGCCNTLRRVERYRRAVGEYLGVHGADLGSPGSLAPAEHALAVEDLAWCADAVSTFECDWWTLHTGDRGEHLELWRRAGRPYVV